MSASENLSEPQFNKFHMGTLYHASDADLQEGDLILPKKTNKGMIASAMTTLADAKSMGEVAHNPDSPEQPALFNNIYEIEPIDHEEAYYASGTETGLGFQPRRRNDPVISRVGFRVKKAITMVPSQNAMPAIGRGTNTDEWRDTKKGARPARKHDN